MNNETLILRNWRGGGCSNRATYFRLVYRGRSSPDNRYYLSYGGFRIILVRKRIV